MRLFALLFFLCLAAGTAAGQNLIGSRKSEIKQYMEANRKDMYPNKVKNTMYSYLKYTDNTDRETILFFLDNDSVCSSVRVICDRSMRPGLLADLDKRYRKTGDSTWIDEHDNRNCLVRLIDDTWLCTVTFETEKRN